MASLRRDGVTVGGLALRSIDQRVARDGDAVGRLPVRGEVEQDRGVRAAAGLAIDPAAVAVAESGPSPVC